jgi:hypothetical protein
MPYSSVRPVLFGLVCLTVACNLPRKPEGECTGELAGRSVKWPISVDAVHSPLLSDDGRTDTMLALQYESDEPAGFGVDLVLTGEPRFEGGTPRIAKLMPQGELLVPEETSVVWRWGAHLGGLPGFPLPPGMPLEGSVTLERVTPDHAAGRFVYQYEGGAALTCTFDISDRWYGGSSGGEGSSGRHHDWDD